MRFVLFVHRKKGKANKAKFCVSVVNMELKDENMSVFTSNNDILEAQISLMEPHLYKLHQLHVSQIMCHSTWNSGCHPPPWRQPHPTLTLSLSPQNPSQNHSLYVHISLNASFDSLMFLYNTESNKNNDKEH